RGKTGTHCHVTFRCSKLHLFLSAKTTQTVAFAGITKNYLSEKPKGSEVATKRKVVSGHDIANREPIRFLLPLLSLFSLHYFPVLVGRVLAHFHFGAVEC